MMDLIAANILHIQSATWLYVALPLLVILNQYIKLVVWLSCQTQLGLNHFHLPQSPNITIVTNETHHHFYCIFLIILTPNCLPLLSHDLSNTHTT